MKSQNTSPKGIWSTKTVNPTVSVCLLSKAFRNFLERCRIIKVNNKTIMVPRKCPRRQPLNCKDLVLLGYKSIPLCLWRECELSDLVFLSLQIQAMAPISHRKKKTKLKWENKNSLCDGSTLS